MGSPVDELGREADEGPRHEVEITRPFWLGAYQVTQEEYQRVRGTNPSYFSEAGGGKEQVAGLDTSRFPVESVSWEDAVAFCAALSALPGEVAAGRCYRLPSEAEWEYACRAGATDGAPFHTGWTLSPSQANIDGRHHPDGAAPGTALGRPAAVGSYAPNAWGLYDLHGNVFEWCQDWYGGYSKDSQTNPKGSDFGPFRLVRGGSWGRDCDFCRAAFRTWSAPASRIANLGLRVSFCLD
jgi:formylglycine-generating enzyme required for sulfatase activity